LASKLKVVQALLRRSSLKAQTAEKERLAKKLERLE
jgi:hypothetical protein